MATFTSLTHRLPLDEDFPYPPSPFLEEESARLGLGWRLVILAVLGSVLGFVGLEVANSHAPATSNQIAVASGVQTMSAAELIQNVKTQQGLVYWLNSRQGDSYADDTLTDGVDQISYRPEGSNVSNLNQFDVMIGTYRDFATYDAQPHPFLGANGVTLSLNSGATLTYNQMSPDRAVVSFPNTPEIVVLNYPTPQAVPTLISDAQNLVPIN